MPAGRALPADLGLWLAMLGMLVAPFYPFPSGNPQPADFCFVAFCAVFLFRSGGRLHYPAEAGPFLTLTIAFATWVALVNTWWTGWTGSLQLSRATVFYAYNCGIMMVYVLAYQHYGRRWLTGTVWASAGAILGQVLLAPTKMRWGAVRQELFYNNPNQLAYFALLMGVIVYAGSQRLKIPTWLQAAVYLATALLVVLSASRAALMAIVAFIGLLALRRPALLLVMGVAAVAAATATGLEPLSLFDRALDLEQGTNRGYFRLVRYPYYLILGAGEGYVHRFAVVDNWEHELHSNFATLLFCYGIVGSSLFAALNWQIVRMGGVLAALALMPPYVFGVTHQGLRFTQLWILLGFLVCLSVESRRESTKQAATEPMREAV